jgi:hypothetical protein
MNGTYILNFEFRTSKFCVRHNKKFYVYSPCTIVRIVKSCLLQGTGYEARTRTGSIEDLI